MTYKLIRNSITNNVDTVMCIISETEYKSFAFDESNPDYQEYLEWLDEGNTPEEAD